MEIYLNKEQKICKKCNQIRHKKFEFITKKKYCKSCIYNTGNRYINNKVSCRVCLWTGSFSDYNKHICINNNSSNLKNKLIYTNDIKPFNNNSKFTLF